MFQRVLKEHAAWRKERASGGCTVGVSAGANDSREGVTRVPVPREECVRHGDCVGCVGWSGDRMGRQVSWFCNQPLRWIARPNLVEVYKS